MVQAVRSFLHFSQLSAWLNKSNGARPSAQQLLYRVTMPGQAFASKFAGGAKPVEHFFPVALVGRLRTHVVKVSVSSLPRTDVIPQVHCSKCRFPKTKRHEDDVDGHPATPQQQHQFDGLLDLPPAQLRLQPRLRRSRSRSGSPSIDSVRLIRPTHPNHNHAIRNAILTGSDKVLDDVMRINCNRIGKHDCNCVSREDEELKDELEVVKLPADHGDRWGHDLERGRRLDPTSVEPIHPTTERGRSRRSRKDCFAKYNEINQTKTSNGSDVTEETSAPSVFPQVGKNVPTSDDKLRFQRSLNSAASLLFHHHTPANNGQSNGVLKDPLFRQRFPLKFLRSPPLRMSSSPLLGSFEVIIIVRIQRWTMI